MCAGEGCRLWHPWRSTHISEKQKNKTRRSTFCHILKSMSNFAAACVFFFLKTNSWWHCSVWCSTSNPVSQLAVFTAKPLWQAFGLRAFAARRKTNLVETVARRARNRYCYCETWLTWHSVVLGGVFLCVSSVRDSGALWLRSNCWAQTSTYYAATTCLKCYRAGTRPIRVKS